MAKKGGASQLQAEINDDEEWEKYLLKPGLLVIDIYAEWSGPCSSMIATLKKVKLEIGGDDLQLAIAKSDTITALERFRNTCEPTWMFVCLGKMVNLMYGANAPKLTNMISNELKKYQAVKEGAALVGFEICELADEERVRYEAKKAIEDEVIRIETERMAQELLDRRTAVTDVVLELIPKNGVIVVFPMVKTKVKAALADQWEPAGLMIAATEKMRFTEEVLEELLFFTEDEFNADDLENLLSDETIVYLVKPRDMDGFTETTIDQAVLEFVYGEMKCYPGSPDSPAEKLTTHLVVKKPEPKVESDLGLALELDDLEDMDLEAQGSQAELEPQEEEAAKEEDKAGSEEGSEEDEGSEGSKTQLEKAEEKKVSIVKEEEKVEEEVETYPVSGLWAPPNLLVTATAIKLMFPKLYDPIALAPPIVIPPHIAIAFETFKRKEVAELMDEYSADIMRYGYFTSDDPKTAQLVAKNMVKYATTRTLDTSRTDRLVIQLSKKKSEAWCAFANLDPTFMSFNTVEGAEHCKLFFPEGYDEEVKEEEVVVKKKKKKGKKTEEADTKEKPTKEKKEEAAAVAVGGGEEDEGEGDGEEDNEEGDEEDGEGSTADKGTDALE